MITISLCMIVKNEEDVIARCLDSIKYIVDEIIIVDTGSTDNTKEIVKAYTDKVFDFKWIDDFYAARNAAFSKATKGYILWLDADAINHFNIFLNTEKGWIEDNISACFDLSICYNFINDKKNMLRTLLRSFEYDIPRAEICCQLGYYYLEKKDYERSIFWYKTAAETILAQMKTNRFKEVFDVNRKTSFSTFGYIFPSML